MNDTFAIGIPTINRADLLNPTLEKYARDFPTTQIFVLDNGYQDLHIDYPNMTLVLPNERNDRNNLGVAGSWNALCKLAFGQDIDIVDTSGRPNLTWSYLWLLNDDVYMGIKESSVVSNLLEEYLKMDRQHRYGMFTAPDNMSSFLLSKSCFEAIGSFDEKFYPAYYEDNDYRYRMKLARWRAISRRWLHPEVFRVSSSIQKNPSLNIDSQANLQYYIAKWGGLPGEEIYREPFDGK